MVAGLQVGLGRANLGATQLSKQGNLLGLHSHLPCGLRFRWRLSFRLPADEAPKSGIDRDRMLHYLSVGLLPLFGAGLRSPLAIKPALGLGFESSSALPMDTSFRVSLVPDLGDY